MSRSIRTRVNNPERVFLDSADDGRNTTTNGFSEFTCTFDTPILGAKKTALIRATIPNAQITIPNYQLVFWYYSLPTATTAPTAASLRAVRLYPSDYFAPAALTTFTKNRYISDPNDFIALLNVAAGAGGDSVTYNPFWVQADVTFSYDALRKQITFVGNTSGRFYVPAGWNDPIVNTAVAGQTIVMPSFATIAVTYPQPLVQGVTLNLRVGYAMSGTSFGPQVTQPAPPIFAQYANLTHTAVANGQTVIVDSYPDLVYSQCIYLYSNIVAGVSLGSGGQHNLLAIIPSNAIQLGVIQYTALTTILMSKLVDTIYDITVEMRDDNNQRFLLPDNANVNIELGFVYE